MNIRYFLLASICLSASWAHTQNCGNPVTLSSVLVSNTQCGVSTGTVILSLPGGNGQYNFNWTPNVSSSNVATLLQAGTYLVHITRNNEPACVLDTLILVNNSNGPQVQASISPAQCQSTNGAISLTPTNLLYNWNTGASTPGISGLASKNYYVTVTNPSTGCFSVFKYFVPHDFNGLTVNTLIQADAKCGMSTGRAQVIVTGGSGQYTYTPGPGPNYTNLAAGSYTIQVKDQNSNCTGATTFNIQDLQVSGTVDVTPHDAHCSNQADGFVEFGVSATQNFALPYTFTLKDSNGNPHTPGSLAAGNYTLQITDADGCSLPTKAFTIGQPPVFTPQVQASPETCASGGQILLNISGGNGTPYVVNWTDLPGDDNPKDRLHLRAGKYSAIVYDSLFCAYKLDTVLIESKCNNLSIVHLVVGANSVEHSCAPAPVGLASGATSYTLLGGGVSGNSSYGNWNLGPDGCLSYAAGSQTGFGVDTICIISTAPSIGLKDTTCIVVSISQGAPSKQSVFFSVQVQNSATACGAIPPGFSNYKVVQLGRPGLTGFSDVFGAYEISDPSACLAFFANNAPGFNVDEIRAAVYELGSKKCHIISYYPTVLPKNECDPLFSSQDTLHLITTDCNGTAPACIPIPYDDIVNYTLIDNSGLYNGGYSGCNEAPTISYTLSSLPSGGGPYELTEWKINGQVFTGNFLNVSGLIDLMNNLDPGADNWAMQGSNLIRGGLTSATYGPLRVRSATGAQSVYNGSLINVSMGTRLQFTPGFHRIIFRNTLTACSDTMPVEVVCYNCAPVHSYPVNAFGQVAWGTENCDADTIFCSNIPNSDLGHYTVTDNGQTFTGFTLCGNFVGMLLDTGLHQLHILDLSTTCEWTVPVLFDCKDILHESTIPVTVPLGATQSVCLDTSFVPSPISSISNICEQEGNDNVGYGYDQQHWCVNIIGQHLGMDTLCIQLCNDLGSCANYYLIITVSNAAADSLLAVPDVVFTLKNEPLSFNIIENDIINGLTGNIQGLSNIEILGNPAQGAISFNPADGTLTYTPDQNVCGVDSFTYRITDLSGKQSVAKISVTISCDKVLVFKGISPNGDGRNDEWHLIGIEQFPGNEVQVYNRWGNLVYQAAPYSNDHAWNGQWNGKDLPDGTYFYIIDLGGNAGRLSGWLQILR